MRGFPLTVRRQKGVAAVEFALIAILFFTLLFGVVEIARVLFTWNSAVEATRYGARVAAVCDMNDPAIKNRIRKIMPNLADSAIRIKYMYLNPDTKVMVEGCTQSTCDFVEVSINPFKVETYIPFVSAELNLKLPSFATALPRESMDSNNNPVCT